MKPEIKGLELEMISGKDAHGKPYQYQGYSAAELLKDLRIEEQVEFLGQDGEIVAVAAEEILAGGVYLVRETDSLRLIIPSDVHRRRWCKNILEVLRKEVDKK